MANTRYKAMMEKVEKVEDLRLSGLWLILGEKVEVGIAEYAVPPVKEEEAEKRFEELLLADPAGAPILRHSVDYFPNPDCIRFVYDPEDPRSFDNHQETDRISLDIEDSKFGVLFAKVPNEMLVHFWNR